MHFHLPKPLNGRREFVGEVGIIVVAVLILTPAAAAARGPVPLRDPVVLNIGLNCQWQQRCMDVQRTAMSRALGFVRKRRPAAWRIQQCNRNAARSRSRVDWVGFDNCIRNAALRPGAARPVGKRARLSFTSPGAGDWGRSARLS
jgi:hypothetical protein